MYVLLFITVESPTVFIIPSLTPPYIGRTETVTCVLSVDAEDNSTTTLMISQIMWNVSTVEDGILRSSSFLAAESNIFYDESNTLARTTLVLGPILTNTTVRCSGVAEELLEDDETLLVSSPGYSNDTLFLAIGMFIK